ncbi:MAG: hypothetical protein IIZ33_05555 [Erysipelotrichaceae bacterium]|nr:hypothetical protein [Erysipelotrichaceae bacterium]
MKQKKKRKVHPVRVLLILLILAGFLFLVIREIIEKQREESIHEDISYLPSHNYDWNKLDNSKGYLTYEDENHTSSFGIDISEHNGDIDFEKIKEEGVEFVFIRAGWRGAVTGYLNKDKRFEEYYEGAKRAGLSIGFYFFSQAVNEEEAIEEADYLASLVKGKSFDLPLVYDYEDFSEGRIEELDGKTRTANALAFLERIAMHNYKGILYTNLNWLRWYYDVKDIIDLDIWFAQYHDVPQYPHPFRLWQYSEEGELEGIEEKVDFNIMFIEK